MVSENVIYKVKTLKDTSYRLVKQNDVFISDKSSAVKPNSTDYRSLFDSLYDEFIDFKKYVLTEMSRMNDNDDNSTGKNRKPQSLNQQSSLNETNQVIACLRERIFSLEKQLDEKQKLIELLISCLTGEKATDISEKPLGKNSKKSKEIFGAKIPKDTNEKKTPTSSPVKCSNVIIGDSILNGINENGIKTKEQSVVIKPYSGATTEDISDLIKPEIRKRPGTIIIHSGTNDLTKKVDTVENLKKIIEYTKQYSSHTKLIISSITVRTDKIDLKKKAVVANTKMKDFAEKNNILFLDNSNINENCLSAKKLHLNAKGKACLAKNFKDILNNNTN